MLVQDVCMVVPRNEDIEWSFSILSQFHKPLGAHAPPTFVAMLMK